MGVVRSVSNSPETLFGFIPDLLVGHPLTDFVDVLRLARAMPISAATAAAASGTAVAASPPKKSAAKREKLLAEMMSSSRDDDVATDAALTELMHGNQSFNRTSSGSRYNRLTSGSSFNGKSSGSTYTLTQVRTKSDCFAFFVLGSWL